MTFLLPPGIKGLNSLIDPEFQVFFHAHRNHILLRESSLKHIFVNTLLLNQLSIWNFAGFHEAPKYKKTRLIMYAKFTILSWVGGRLFFIMFSFLGRTRVIIYWYNTFNVCFEHTFGFSLHCMKSVQIRCFFWPVFSCIQSGYRKIQIRKSSVFGHFSRSVKLILDVKGSSPNFACNIQQIQVS